MSLTHPLVMALAMVFATGILWAIYSIEEHFLRQQTKQRHPAFKRKDG